MIWIAPSEKDTDNAALEKRLWDAADQFRANSASDARSSEQDLRRQLIESRAVDVMVAVGPNMFYTVTLPCTLWFLDKSKAGRAALPRSPKLGTSSNSSLPDRSDTVLFIDARHIYRQVDRAHREWTPAQIGFLANLVRLYRGEELDFTLGGDEARAKIDEIFGGTSSASPQSSGKSGTRVTRPSDGLAYHDVAGLCRAATLKEIEAQGWSLNPGRYVGVAAGEAVSDEDFKEQLETLNEELETIPQHGSLRPPLRATLRRYSKHENRTRPNPHHHL